MKRALAVLALVLIAAVAVYYFFVRDKEVAATVQPLALAGTIGGEDAVVVNGRGEVLTWLVIPEDLALPELPLDEVPKSGRVKGTMLEQAKILAATPTALRPYVASSRYGESGVDVELTSGIELRFGDASQAKRKWEAAAAVLASEEIEALDYVDLHAPGRPAVDGEGVILPPLG